MAQVFIGTSGWTYPSWKGNFYLENLPSTRFLEFYTNRFPTTEINYSFYHLPKPSTYEKWVAQVPEGFVFAVKASRFITHTKRLKCVDEPWGIFLQNAQSLGSGLGPILFQFPASFRCDPVRLTEFLARVRTVGPEADRLRLVFEFRHAPWFVDEGYRLLSGHGAVLCLLILLSIHAASSPRLTSCTFVSTGVSGCSPPIIRKRISPRKRGR